MIATKVVRRRPVKDLTPHPKPAHPATVKPKELQMQKKLQCKKKCNAKTNCNAPIIATKIVSRRVRSERDLPPQTSPFSSCEA